MTGRGSPPADHEAPDVRPGVQPHVTLTVLHRLRRVRQGCRCSALHRAEQLLDPREHLAPVEVANTGQRGIRRVIVPLVKSDALAMFARFDIAFPSDRMVSIRMWNVRPELDRP